MKNHNRFCAIVLLTFLGSIVYSCIPGSLECPQRPLTEKEIAFANKYDPGMLYTTIHRVNYEYRDGYMKQHSCTPRNPSREYMYMFNNETVESFVDTATIRDIVIERIVELYSDVVSDSVLFATKSFNLWIENEAHARNSKEGETYYEVDVKIADVASYVGFKVVKKGNRLVRQTIPKSTTMKFDYETFDPLIERQDRDE